MISRIIYKDKPKAPTFRALVLSFFKDNSDCEVATISISKGKPKRSDAQNRLYWMWAGILAKEIGYSKDEMHLILADKFLDKFEFTTKEGDTISQIPSTRDLNVMQFVDYIFEIEMFSAEWDIKLPRTEDYGLAVYDEHRRGRVG